MALERQSIEKKDFPIGRRGYDPEAVDAHLRILADEIEELKRASRRRTETLASTASEQVRAIVEAAETSAAAIQREAEEEAREIRSEASNEAAATREQANEQAREYVGRVSESTAVMLQRVDAMESELSALVESLRTGANRLNADLQLLESNLNEVRDAVGPRFEAERSGSSLGGLGGGTAGPAAGDLASGPAGPAAGAVTPAVAPVPDAGAVETTPQPEPFEPLPEPEPLPSAAPLPEAGSPVAAPAVGGAAAGSTIGEPAGGGSATGAGSGLGASATGGSALDEPVLDEPVLDEPAFAEPAFEEPTIAQPEVGGAAGGEEDVEGARLIALNMALNGTPRDETDRYLAENFDLSDRASLLDEVYASVEG